MPAELSGPGQRTGPPSPVGVTAGGASPPPVFRGVGERARFSANAYNAFVELLRGERSHGHDTIAESAYPRPDVVLVENVTADVCPRFGVLGIDGVSVKPIDSLAAFQERQILRGVVPTEDHKGRFVVALEPIEPGTVGQARVAGLGVVVVQPSVVDADAPDDARADVADEQVEYLQGGTAGAAEILWLEPFDDRVNPARAWAVIRLGAGPGTTLRPIRAVLDPITAELNGNATEPCGFLYAIYPVDGSIGDETELADGLAAPDHAGVGRYLWQPVAGKNYSYGLAVRVWDESAEETLWRLLEVDGEKPDTFGCNCTCNEP